MLKHGLLSFVLLIGSLGIGILGYHFLEGLFWIDALGNASTLLGDMGPVNPLQTTSGKVFASFYALYSGVIFLIIAGYRLNCRRLSAHQYKDFLFHARNGFKPINANWFKTICRCALVRVPAILAGAAFSSHRVNGTPTKPP